MVFCMFYTFKCEEYYIGCTNHFTKHRFCRCFYFYLAALFSLHFSSVLQSGFHDKERYARYNLSQYRNHTNITCNCVCVCVCLTSWWLDTDNTVNQWADWSESCVCRIVLLGVWKHCTALQPTGSERERDVVANSDNAPLTNVSIRNTVGGGTGLLSWNNINESCSPDTVCSPE